MYSTTLETVAIKGRDYKVKILVHDSKQISLNFRELEDDYRVVSGQVFTFFRVDYEIDRMFFHLWNDGKFHLGSEFKETEDRVDGRYVKKQVPTTDWERLDSMNMRRVGTYTNDGKARRDIKEQLIPTIEEFVNRWASKNKSFLLEKDWEIATGNLKSASDEVEKIKAQLQEAEDRVDLMKSKVAYAHKIWQNSLDSTKAKV